MAWEPNPPVNDLCYPQTVDLIDWKKYTKSDVNRAREWIERNHKPAFVRPAQAVIAHWDFFLTTDDETILQHLKVLGVASIKRLIAAHKRKVENLQQEITELEARLC